jgi:aquaporin Z
MHALRAKSGRAVAETGVVKDSGPARQTRHHHQHGAEEERLSESLHRVEEGVLGWIDRDVIQPMQDFQDPHQEWRRLFSELYGTFLLVIVAAGGGMMDEAFPNTITRTAAVVAPGLMVMGIILFMGKVSGAHLNPAVSVAFSLRGDFPWRRVPGYIIVQLAGATLAALFLRGVIKVSAKFGSNYVAHGFSGWQGYLMEALLTLGLVSVILGTASGAQNIGIFGALGVGGYIALAGLWGSPISGASMNPARTFGPDLVGGDFGSYWVYVAGPLTGAVIAVGIAYVLRGPGGGRAGSAAAQGDLFTEERRPQQT